MNVLESSISHSQFFEAAHCSHIKRHGVKISHKVGAACVVSVWSEMCIYLDRQCWKAIGFQMFGQPEVCD